MPLTRPGHDSVFNNDGDATDGTVIIEAIEEGLELVEGYTAGVLPNAAQARTNLGLGTAAVAAATAFDAAGAAATVAATLPSASPTKTANYTLTTTDLLILADATAGGFTLTLPPAASMPVGVRYRIRKADATSNEVVVAPNGAQTIDGAPYLVLALGESSVTLFSDGSNVWAV